MSSSCSIGCLFVLIASLVFAGAAARRSFSGQDRRLLATQDKFSMQDAIEKAGSVPYLLEFARAPKYRSNSAVRIRGALRFRAPAHPIFPWLAVSRARTREFGQSSALEQAVRMCHL